MDALPSDTGPVPIEQRYRAALAAGDLVPDPAQARAVGRLAALALALRDYRPAAAGRGWRARLGLGTAAPAPPKGLYLCGAVGRGKSMLLDLFFAAAPVALKKRVHFYAFMRDIHDRIHARRGAGESGDPIAPVAAAIAAEATLLCFDEFDVTDIADAMILGRLFAALFAAGVVVVATSNRAPDELYRDGLQRDRFLPFIALLKERMAVVPVDGGRDYRLARFAGRQTYFVAPDGGGHRALEAAFADLTGGAEGRPVKLDVLGHAVAVPRAAKGVAWFGFDELCARPLGAPDYLALCRTFHAFVVEAIPVMGRPLRNEAKRFTIFIDTLYEAHGNLVASAAAPPEALYPAGDGSFEFRRTVSRLAEMQSADYIAGRRGS
jgi:cell division protein ZapE